MVKMSENKMRQVQVEKVTVNMGVGQTGEELERAVTIMESITGKKAVRTVCKVKQPTWGIREGLTIGVKVTLRKNQAIEFLKKALVAKENTLKKKNFDVRGNFGFGIREHIDLAGVKYDPKFGIRGLDVLVTMKRPGYRIKRRKIDKKKIPATHAIKRQDAIDHMKEKYGVEIK